MKNIEKELHDWLNTLKPASHPRARKLASFLAIKQEIEAAIQQGYSVKAIWEFMTEKGKTTYCYQSFLGQVKKHIKHPEIETTKKSDFVTELKEWC